MSNVPTTLERLGSCGLSGNCLLAAPTNHISTQANRLAGDEAMVRTDKVVCRRKPDINAPTAWLEKHCMKSGKWSSSSLHNSQRRMKTYIRAWLVDLLKWREFFISWYISILDKFPATWSGTGTGFIVDVGEYYVPRRRPTGSVRGVLKWRCQLQQLALCKGTRRYR